MTNVIRYLGPCMFAGPRQPATCDGCSATLACVYAVDDGGWVFLFCSDCYAAMPA